MMNSKDFTALADAIIAHNKVDTKKVGGHVCRFTTDELECLANFCADRNPQFSRERFMMKLEKGGVRVRKS